MNVLVVGSTGGTGYAAVTALVERGHTVTAMVRRPASSPPFPAQVKVVQGDATRADDVERCVRGQDAVVVTLGIREPALRVRVLGSASTPLQVRSQGTAQVIAMMRRHGVQKLVVLTSFGVGPTRASLSLKWRLIFALLLRPQIADTEVQQAETVASGLRWVVAQPVALTDAQPAPEPFASVHGEVRGMSISRHSVARFLADAVEGDAFDHRIVALS